MTNRMKKEEMFIPRALSTGGGGEASIPNTISSPKTNEILEEIDY